VHDKRIANIPNLVTLLRFLLIPLLCFFVLNGARVNLVITVLVFYTLDLIDGYLARRLKQQSEFGSQFDKATDGCAILSAVFCFALTGMLQWWLFLLILVKDILQTSCAIALYRKALPYPRVYLIKGRYGFGTPMVILLLLATFVNHRGAKGAFALMAAAMLTIHCGLIVGRSISALRRGSAP
jgi:phosphatidylglycerophosphate synthase